MSDATAVSKTNGFRAQVKKKAVCFWNVKQYVEYTVTTEKVQMHISDVLHYAGDQVENNYMDRACDAYWGEESCTQGSDGETWGEETSW